MQNPLMQVARFVTIATAILLGVAVVRGVTFSLTHSVHFATNWHAAPPPPFGPTR